MCVCRADGGCCRCPVAGPPEPPGCLSPFSVIMWCRPGRLCGCCGGGGTSRRPQPHTRRVPTLKQAAGPSWAGAGTRPVPDDGGVPVHTHLPPSSFSLLPLPSCPPAPPSCAGAPCRGTSLSGCDQSLSTAVLHRVSVRYAPGRLPFWRSVIRPQ